MAKGINVEAPPESVLGPQRYRKKTDLRLMPIVRDTADEYSEALGVALNATVTLALLEFCTRHALALRSDGRTRKSLIKALRTEYERICDELEARNSVK